MRSWFSTFCCRLGLILGLAGLVACGDAGTTPDQSITPIVTQTTVAIDTPLPQPIDTPSSSFPDLEPIELLVWLTPENALSSNSTKGEMLSAQLEAFDESNAGIQIKVAEKVASGQGGILSYLRTGKTVAPNALPDLILLPASLLPTAANESLIFPFSSLISPELVADLFPAATELGSYNAELFGLPYLLDGLTHYAYNTATFTDTVPATWQEVAEKNSHITLPASGADGADLLLTYYLGMGGNLLDEAGNWAIQPNILANALSQFSQGVAEGWVRSESSGISTYQELWATLSQENAGIIPVSAEIFLRERVNGQTIGYLPLLSSDVVMPPLVNGWVWVMTTPDPNRQQIASELISWLMDDANLGGLTANSLVLPARRTTFSIWPANDPYIIFIQHELEKATIYPIDAGSNLRTTFKEALLSVIVSALTPDQAAQQVVDQLNGG